jgi:hypothetical protein
MVKKSPQFELKMIFPLIIVTFANLLKPLQTTQKQGNVNKEKNFIHC